MEPITDQQHQVIETTRRVARSLAREISSKGIPHPDIAIGFVYALHDIATELNEDPVAAIEWIRNAADVMESSFLGGACAEPPASH